MDDLAKKLFVQLDDDMPGVRGNAVEMLHALHKKNGQSCRSYIPQIERGEQYDVLEQEAVMLRQQVGALDGELTQYKAAVGKWQNSHAAAAASSLLRAALRGAKQQGRSSPPI